MTDHVIRFHSRIARAPFGIGILALLVIGMLAISGHSAFASTPADAATDLVLEEAPTHLVAKDLARAAEDNMRSDRTFFRGKMTVTSPRLARDRVVAFHSWEDSQQHRSLIRIDAPSKDKGTGFLKLHPNLWMYIPRVERTVRVPPSMMLQSWMGSDFSNDDLVRESSEIDDYDHRILGIDAGLGATVDRRAYVVEYKPHEDAAVIWGSIIAWLDMESNAPLRQDFFDEEGERLRIMRFSDFRKIDDRFVPHLWTITPLNKPGHSTSIEIEEIRFDPEMKSSLFTTRNLKRKE